jgi:hypothetical protein
MLPANPMTKNLIQFVGGYFPISTFQTSGQTGASMNGIAKYFQKKLVH